MKHYPEAVPIERYIAIDLHKEYVMIGGQNAQQEWVMRPRKVSIYSFRNWAAKNLKPGDAVVLDGDLSETSDNHFRPRKQGLPLSLARIGNYSA
ncbi:MAG: hypothetical protein U9Q82_07240 [Chloroflexota bacterium]|nr:hypothetical protein [Chloroflexota bacterium]